VVRHQGKHGRAVHEGAGKRGLDGATCGAEVLVGAKGFCAVRGGDAKIDGSLGSPGDVGANGARGDEGAGLEYLLWRVAQDAVCDCCCAV
jgi:hypothetical protein